MRAQPTSRPSRRPRPLIAVGDGDRVFDLSIIETPGHTAGHIAVLDDVAGLLVAGDALNTVDGAVTGPNPQFSDDMATAEASVRKLAGFTFGTLLVGHGDPITDGASEPWSRLSRPVADLDRGHGQMPTDDVGDIAPNGSPVAFYRRLPADGGPEPIDGLIAAGASVLDLGCGPGRIAGPLVALGHPVTGVDDGAAMIAALPAGVEGVVGDARRIRLGRRFGAVLLASHLLNDPDGGPDVAATAAAHLAPDGVVIGETYPPRWNPRAASATDDTSATPHVELVPASVVGDRLEAEVRYGVDDSEWHQAFTARLLDEAGLRDLLRGARLTLVRWLDRPGWFVARGD